MTEHNRPSSLLCSDDWRAYPSLPFQGDNVAIGKERGRSKGRDHLNFGYSLPNLSFGKTWEVRGNELDFHGGQVKVV
jgi:hypothetical protein